jgi:deoxyribose-phosphate aldolase
MRYLPYIDLTSLNENNTAHDIKKLCHQALSAPHNIAAICILPQHLKYAQPLLEGSAIKLASVANFPAGNDSLDYTLEQILQMIDGGAQEIDLVIPYTHYLNDDKKYVFTFLNACRQACEKTTLKVILETGALISHDHIVDAATIAIECGADFIKTSTGTINIGATPNAVESMLTAIQATTNKKVGLKISGGIKSIEAAHRYYQLISSIMGAQWINPSTFRIGSSKLLNIILNNET